MSKILQISVNANRENLEAVMPAISKAIDWARYAPNCWLVYTTSDVSVWFHRIRPLLHDQDTFLIIELPLDRANTGYLPKTVWEWIAKYTEKPIHPIPALPPPDIQS